MTTQAQEAALGIFERLEGTIGNVIRGQKSTLRHLLAAMASGGHVLLEDYPGTGKTTLAKALARALDVQFRRVQFTPDLLPSDILGVAVFNQKEQDFEFHQGPVFTNILLADEVNRASPRTQSALLESMAEGQVSVEGERRPLPDLFFVIATQNPVEFRGTYPLPEAQMDRFAMQLGLGYLAPEDETEVLAAQVTGHPLDSVKPCASLEDILVMRRAASEIRVSDEVRRYMVDLVGATRKTIGVRLGASPRASLAMMKASQALALFDEMECVTPDHVQELAKPVIAHRLVLDPQAEFSGQSREAIVQGVIRKLTVPA